jgi:hypothetical protein
MTIGIDQYRMRVGLFKPNRQQSKCYLNLCKVLSIGLIINTRNKKHALLAAVLIQYTRGHIVIDVRHVRFDMSDNRSDGDRCNKKGHKTRELSQQV